MVLKRFFLFGFITEMTFSSHFPEKFREIYNFAFGWAKEKVNTVLHKECAWIYA